MENERERRLRELDEEYGEYMRYESGGVPFYVGHEAWNYVLVEKSSYDASYYVTMHPTPSTAAEYHDSQESTNDWNVEFLIHAVSGARYTPITTTTFKEDS